MLSELAIPHIRCCLSAIPSDLMKSTVVDESLSSMNQQFCSRENQLLQRQKAMHKAFVAMENKVNLQCKKIIHLENLMLIYGIYNLETLKN